MHLGALIARTQAPRPAVGAANCASLTVYLNELYAQNNAYKAEVDAVGTSPDRQAQLFALRTATTGQIAATLTQLNAMGCNKPKPVAAPPLAAAVQAAASPSAPTPVAAPETSAAADPVDSFFSAIENNLPTIGAVAAGLAVTAVIVMKGNKR